MYRIFTYFSQSIHKIHNYSQTIRKLFTNYSQTIRTDSRRFANYSHHVHNPFIHIGSRSALGM